MPLKQEGLSSIVCISLFYIFIANTCGNGNGAAKAVCGDGVQVCLSTINGPQCTCATGYSNGPNGTCIADGTSSTTTSEGLECENGKSFPDSDPRNPGHCTPRDGYEGITSLSLSGLLHLAACRYVIVFNYISLIRVYYTLLTQALVLKPPMASKNAKKLLTHVERTARSTTVDQLSTLIVISRIGTSLQLTRMRPPRPNSLLKLFLPIANSMVQSLSATLKIPMAVQTLMPLTGSVLRYP